MLPKIRFMANRGGDFPEVGHSHFQEIRFKRLDLSRLGSSFHGLTGQRFAVTNAIGPYMTDTERTR